MEGSTTTTAATGRSRGPAAPGGVVGELARFHGARGLRSPLLWLGLLASVVTAWMSARAGPPTLQWRSVAIAGSCLPLAAAALLRGQHSAMRDRRHDTVEGSWATPTGIDRRMLGLAAAGWAPVALSLGVVAVGVALSLGDDPAGTLDVAELAVGPLAVAAGHGAGVALGRWLPHPVVGSVALVLLAGLFVVGEIFVDPGPVPADSPYLPWRRAYTDFVQAEPRLPLLRLAYLTALAATAALVAARRWLGAVAGAVTVAAVAVGLAGLETDGEEIVAAVHRWDAGQPRACETHGGVRYCAIAGYEPWIDDWVSAVALVQEVVPVPLGVSEVQQVSLPAARDDTDPAVAHVGGRLRADAGLTPQLLAPELGLPGTAGEAAEVNSHLPECMAELMPVFVSGEARGVALAALTELVVPGSLGDARHRGPNQVGHVEVSPDEVQLARRILQRPRREILSTLHQRWREVTDPATTSAELAAWFGLEAPEVATAPFHAGMDCTCTGEGGVSCRSR